MQLEYVAVHIMEMTDDEKYKRGVGIGLFGDGGAARDEHREEEWGDKLMDRWRVSERERRGRSREMIPLSNPLDTRLVWLPTGSERETEAGGRCKQREAE